MIKDIKILKIEILSEKWGVLKRVQFEYKQQEGSTEVQTREV
jgi:hypothetical protein